jgi:putative protease
VSRKNLKSPELLAPAGDFEKLKTAVHYGADAVYFGDSRFSLRSKSRNFNNDEFRDAIEYCKSHNVKAYITLNIFPHNRDVVLLEEHIHSLSSLMPHAFIVSDIGLFTLVKEIAPVIPIHVSIQANSTNWKTVAFWKSFGAQRVVMARELTLDEIIEIGEKVDIEREVFVHGSLCISYSGRCYLSSYLAQRGANAGACTNSCRWSYALVEKKRPGQFLPVHEDERGTYILSPRDLCMIEHIDELIRAGIDSFKIEGRTKGVNYVAGVVKAYREAIDSYLSGCSPDRERLKSELAMVSNRGYTTGFFFGHPDSDAYNFDRSSYQMTHELIGITLNVQDGKAQVALRNNLTIGDNVEFICRNSSSIPIKITFMYGQDNQCLLRAHNNDIVTIGCPPAPQAGDIIRRRITSS